MTFRVLEPAVRPYPATDSSWRGLAGCPRTGWGLDRWEGFGVCLF